jgi:Kef-type K+ transport system membrane component KefB/nucleotide-binding universal stress UspA family protein
MIDFFIHFFKEEPIGSFAILLAVILAVPPVFERIQLPGLVGLLVAGVVLGPNGLKLFQNDSETMKLLSDIGLVYLMFVAGLEVELEQFHKTKHRSAVFGSYTFLVPLITGIAIGRIFNFDWNASILIGSLLASHTLLAYPIVSRLEVVNNEAVTVTIGATIFTDIGALLVLAVCLGVHKGDFNLVNLALLIGGLAAYTAISLIGIDRLGREFFRRSGDEEGKQFLFVLLALFLTALGAQLIGVEKIVGAFLAGLAVNGVVGDGPVKEKIVFVGSVLFIPIFFVDMGLLIDIPTFIRSLTNPQALGLTIAIVLGLIGSKFGAAFLAKQTYHYRWRETLVMWSLSLPQVAATLAATLVGFRAGLLNEEVLNSVIVLMLITATLGPVITARFAPDLTVPDADSDLMPQVPNFVRTGSDKPFLVAVPVYNPATERYLLELAALLAQYHKGQMMPLSIATARTHMNDEQLTGALRRSEVLLETASDVSEEFGVQAEPVIRIDDNIAVGISRASREKNANLIVMGWCRRTGFQARLLGNVIDRVLWYAHCPVVMSRLSASPTEFKRILVPIEHISHPAAWVMQIAQALGRTTQAEITLLHVCDRSLSAKRVALLRTQLEILAIQLSSQTPANAEVKASDNVARTISATAKSYDLVILRVSPRHLSAAGMTVNDIPTQIVGQLNCSVIMVSPSLKHRPQLDQTTKQALQPV